MEWDGGRKSVFLKNGIDLFSLGGWTGSIILKGNSLLKDSVQAPDFEILQPIRTTAENQVPSAAPSPSGEGNTDVRSPSGFPNQWQNLASPASLLHPDRLPSATLLALLLQRRLSSDHVVRNADANGARVSPSRRSRTGDNVEAALAGPDADSFLARRNIDDRLWSLRLLALFRLVLFEDRKEVDKRLGILALSLLSNHRIEVPQRMADGTQCLDRTTPPCRELLGFSVPCRVCRIFRVAEETRNLFVIGHQRSIRSTTAKVATLARKRNRIPRNKAEWLFAFEQRFQIKVDETHLVEASLWLQQDRKRLSFRSISHCFRSRGQELGTVAYAPPTRREILVLADSPSAIFSPKSLKAFR